MTLLEALTALVILGASTAGFLGVFRNAAQSARSAAEWNRATATASSALNEYVGAMAQQDAFLPVNQERTTRIETRPWSPTVDDVVVQVSLPDGRTLTVHRLVRRQ